MTKQTPLILEIKGNSLDDGPGIRSVIFMKGCPLSCVWCHNPESKQPQTEISFDAKDCAGCNTCIETCEKGALSKKNRFYIDRDICNLCFKCVDTCPSGALERVGKEMAVEEIIAQVKKDKPFFDTSGGGVTLSGGEPTFYMGFISELLQAFKGEGIHTLLETCGQFNSERFLKLIYPHTDVIYYDIKIYDDHLHQKYCGISNNTILDNFEILHGRYLDGGVDVLPRVPLIPEITDTEKNIKAIGNFLKKHQVKKAKLMPYHPLWKEKNTKIGIENSETLSQWMGQEKVEVCKRIFQDAGIEV